MGKIKKKLVLVLLLLAIFLVSACGSNKEQKQERPITVYLWSIELLREYAPYVQSQLPDLDIHFVVGNNDLNYYKFLNEKGSLPDIITCRRFSLHDAVELKEQLVDLKNTEEAATIFTGYLENYKYPDGTICWLPLCGEAELFVANKDLFIKHGIPLPKDYKSFKEACASFKALGIKPFVSDWYYDYTPLAILQGLNIHELTSREGQLWRSQYENTGEQKAVGLDKKVWPLAFQRMESFIRDAYVEPQDDNYLYEDMDALLISGKAAMSRMTANVALDHIRRYGMNLVMLPYFGQDGGEDWLLTYPAFQVALNKASAQNEQRKQKMMRILSVMMSEGAQRKLGSRNDVISYSRNAELKISPLLENISPFIESNRIYVRLASTDFFAGSKLAVSKMLKREATAEQAYRIMDEYLRKPKQREELKLKPFDKAYSFTDSKQGGNEANSAMANSLRSYYGSDILVAAGHSFTGPIFNSGYSEKMLGYMVMPNYLESFTKQLTGAELERLLKLYVEGVPDVDVYSAVNPVNYHSLPITSGMEYVVKQGQRHDAFTLKQLLYQGKPLDKNKTYRVTVLDKKTFFTVLAEKLDGHKGSEGFTCGEKRVREAWQAYVMSGKPLLAPSPYLTVE